MFLGIICRTRKAPTLQPYKRAKETPYFSSPPQNLISFEAVYTGTESHNNDCPESAEGRTELEELMYPPYNTTKPSSPLPAIITQSVYRHSLEECVAYQYTDQRERLPHLTIKGILHHASRFSCFKPKFQWRYKLVKLEISIFFSPIVLFPVTMIVNEINIGS